eukprot:TRINITY_DN15425_c0_g1_i1.p1 TRINITY_DN15425_c0_g1~~TRINITY_DN15425_c0_g1_i1.p1  ORF type:complete len:225 (-),score=8.00 TRINITY_DN15425_c0_g1_i1:51-725(-)
MDAIYNTISCCCLSPMTKCFDGGYTEKNAHDVLQWGPEITGLQTDLPEKLRGFFYMDGNPAPEQIMSFATPGFIWKPETRVLISDPAKFWGYAANDGGVITPSGKCSTLALMCTNSINQTRLEFTFDENLDKADIRILLDPVCCSCSCFYHLCGIKCPCYGNNAYCGRGYLCKIPDCLCKPWGMVDISPTKNGDTWDRAAWTNSVPFCVGGAGDFSPVGAYERA